ncbi:hypothetical protein Spica_0224 [Gracilinema caldarium DSM 7334]|uniref:Uncharacterized protein n=2 Tax=Gracilinema caldarium TaxID=215591 RepID=F8EYG0_GRAC1|nr:hypothetical protein Spica_0224 [Gracilinema caldarium DSM 7334]
MEKHFVIVNLNYYKRCTILFSMKLPTTKNKSIDKSLFFFSLLLLITPIIYGQNFKPFTKLFVLKTTHFDIIYSEQSRPTAMRLASFADEVYSEVSSLLGITVPDRIPVTITPDTDEFNGYMAAVPYPHIVLFDTPMDIEWTTFQDPLRSLFLHELTHAISLSSRGGFLKGLHNIFGSWATPTLLTAPMYMIEGVTVSFESLDGYGRANDPLIQQRIRQAVLEKRPLSPFQASGVYDLPPLDRAYYEYGGLFSAWLQKTYGMDTYGELWRAMGARIPLSLFYYNYGFARIFKDTYHTPLKDAWQNFLKTYQSDTVQPLEPSDILVQGLQIRCLTAADNGVYGIDSKEQILFKLDIPQLGQKAKVQRIRSVPDSVYEITLNTNQDHLLLSYYRYSGARATAVVGEYTTAGKATGREWTGLYNASYFRDGVVGIAAHLHTTDLVYIDRAGQRHRLASGTEQILFSKPVPIDDNRIALIVSSKGIRKLAIFNIDEQAFYSVQTDLSDDVDRWRYIRNLSNKGSTLFFAFNHDYRFYKLGSLNLDAENTEKALFFSNVDRFGGVLLPVQTGESILYCSDGSTWDTLARYPMSDEGTYTRFRLVPLDFGTEEINQPVSLSSSQPKQKEAAYNPVRYLNPLKFWLPVPLINNVDNHIRIDGMGIITFFMDPTDTNIIFINAGGDLVGKLGYFDIAWTSLNLGFPVVSSFSDKIEGIDSDKGYLMYRATRASIESPLTISLGDGIFNLHLIPSIAMLLAAYNPENESSAYQWTYEHPLWTYGISLGISNLYRKPWQLFGNGLGLDLYVRATNEPNSGRLDTTLRECKETIFAWFGLRGSLYAAWDKQGLSLDGKNPSFENIPFADVAATEYASQAPGNLPWVTGGELEVKLFSFETQSNISHLYLNRLFATAAYRWVLYETVAESNLQTAGYELSNNIYGHHSMLLKIGTVVSATPITMAPLRYSPYFWAAVKLSNLQDQEPNNDFQLGFALSLEW